MTSFFKKDLFLADSESEKNENLSVFSNLWEEYSYILNKCISSTLLQKVKDVFQNILRILLTVRTVRSTKNSKNSMKVMMAKPNHRPSTPPESEMYWNSWKTAQRVTDCSRTAYGAMYDIYGSPQPPSVAQFNRNHAYSTTMWHNSSDFCGALYVSKRWKWVWNGRGVVVVFVQRGCAISQWRWLHWATVGACRPSW